jgi:hypothetical protein
VPPSVYPDIPANPIQIDLFSFRKLWCFTRNLRGTSSSSLGLGGADLGFAYDREIFRSEHWTVSLPVSTSMFNALPARGTAATPCAA